MGDSRGRRRGPRLRGWAQAPSYAVLVERNFWRWRDRRLVSYDMLAAMCNALLSAVGVWSTLEFGQLWVTLLLVCCVCTACLHASLCRYHVELYVRHRGLIIHLRRLLLAVSLVVSHPRPYTNQVAQPPSGVYALIRHIVVAMGIPPAVMQVFFFRQHWLLSLVHSAVLAGALSAKGSAPVCAALLDGRSPMAAQLLQRAGSLFQDTACINVGYASPLCQPLQSQQLPAHRMCEPVLSTLLIMLSVVAANLGKFLIEQHAKREYYALRNLDARNLGLVDLRHQPWLIPICLYLALCVVWPSACWYHGLYGDEATA